MTFHAFAVASELGPMFRLEIVAVVNESRDIRAYVLNEVQRQFESGSSVHRIVFLCSCSRKVCLWSARALVMIGIRDMTK